MPTLLIHNIDVEFPFEPYPCQIDYMSKVIEALSTGSNALLESPTGTGKTLCLLCASLAWQNAEKLKTPSKMHIGYNLPPTKLSGSNTIGSVGGFSNSTKLIIYASRTHNQLTQVISELRSTGYKPRMTIMASREQLCVHERISKLRGGALNHACSKVSAQRSCMYKNNLENYTGGVEGAGGTGGAPVMDIEQLVQLGREDRVCPYFFSRDVATKSELILLPYNYLIDGSIRSTLRGIEWQDCCVILDEAHNLEQVASDAAAFALSSADIAACILELKQVIRLLQVLGSSGATDATQTSHGSKMMGALNSLPVAGEKPDIITCAKLLEALFALEGKLDAVVLSDKSGPVSAPRGSKCCVLPGSWMVSTLEQIGLTVAMAPQHIIELKKCSDFLMDDTASMLGQGNGGGGRLAVSEPKVSHLAQSLAKVYRSRDLNECMRIAEDFSVFVQEERVDYAATGRGGGSRGWGGRAGGRGGSSPGGKGKAKRVLNYWCFSPGVVMEELKKLGVRSLLLTSGTLSPMEAFREDLKIPFSVFLENPHVISNKQIWVSALSTGPKNKQLKSTFEIRETVEYKDELGDAILGICQSMRGITDETSGSITFATHAKNLDGGILVFFPSYGTMESAAARWKQSGLWESLCKAGGHVIMESRGSSGHGSNSSASGGTGTNASESIMVPANKWSSDMDNDSGTGSAGADASHLGVVKEFEQALHTKGKCILLAVCRGKVSEGIDFRDSKGRIAIITGIPFAPHMDPWVVLKRMHLDDNCRARGSTIHTQLLAHSQAQAHVQRIMAGMASVSSGYGAIPMPSQYTATTTANIANTAVKSISASSVYGSCNSGSGASVGQTILTPPPSSTAVMSLGGGSGSNGGVRSQRLTGQAWYDQSASRAVNQALGRVIRHQKDWGTVFLLDARFQMDRQTSQLSSWVRPRLQKISNFHTAIQGFRQFCAVAMSDPELQPRVKERVIPSRNEREVPTHLYHDGANAASSDYTRQVVVSASSLHRSGSIGHGASDGTDERIGETYIDPSLLMSQQTYLEKSRDLSSGFRISTANGTYTTPRGGNIGSTSLLSSVPSVATASENDLNTMLSQAKAAGKSVRGNTHPEESVKKSIYDTFMDKANSSVSLSRHNRVPTGGSHSSSSLLPNKSPFPVSDNTLRHMMNAYQNDYTKCDKDQMPASLSTSSRHTSTSIITNTGNSLSSKPIKRTLGLAKAVDSSFCALDMEVPVASDAAHGLLRNSTTVTDRGLSFTQSQSGDNAVSSQGTSQISKVDKKSIFKTFIGDLKTRVSEECYKQFISEFRTVATYSKKHDGINDISKIRSFTDSLLRILFNELSQAHLEEATNALATLFPDKHIPVYRATVKTTIQYLARNRPARQAPVGGGTLSGVCSGANGETGPAVQRKRAWPATDLTTTSSKGGNSSGSPHIDRTSLSMPAPSVFARSADPLSSSVIVRPASSGPHNQARSSSAQSDPFSLSQLSQDDSSQAENRASKRARQMQMSSADALRKEAHGRHRLVDTFPEASKKQIVSNRADYGILTNLDNIALTRQPLSANDTPVGDATKMSLLACVICNDCPPQIPCVSRCGHVCCKSCWAQWLKVKSECPVCRQLTSASDIARVIVT